MIRALVAVAALAWSCQAGATELELKHYLPDPAKTPGESNPVLTQEKVCGAGFRTGPFRNVPSSLKHEIYHAYGMSVRACRQACRRGCEIDHLRSLELGGANSRANLWPQSYCGPWNAVQKDALENRLHKLVCAGEMTLQEAQDEISVDWIASYRKRVGVKH